MQETSAVAETVHKIPSGSETRIEITQADLPAHCPTDEMALWNGHPRVYLTLDGEGKAICPYCGAEFVLIDKK